MEMPTIYSTSVDDIPLREFSVVDYTLQMLPTLHISPHPLPSLHRLLHVRNDNCKYHLGEETFKLAQSYMDKLAKHGHQANKAALYGELCALLFAKSHYDEVGWQKRSFMVGKCFFYVRMEKYTPWSNQTNKSKVFVQCHYLCSEFVILYIKAGNNFVFLVIAESAQMHIHANMSGVWEEEKI